MNFFDDLQLVEAALGDLAGFAAGKPVASTTKVAGKTFSVEVVHLANGPVPPYQAISGNFVSVLGIVLADMAAIQAGGPISIAEKLGNSWYGVTLMQAP